MKYLDEQVKKDLKGYFGDRDYAVIAVPEDEALRVFIARTTNLTKEAARRHALSPMSTVVLGRALCGTLLLTTLLKHATDQRLMLKVEGDGPACPIVCEADAKGNVRGFINNRQLETKIKNGKFDVASVIGKGNLTVIKDLGLKTPYESSVPIVSGELAEDIAYYLVKSEQIPSVVALGVLIGKGGDVEAAGGFLVQALPGVTEEALKKIEKTVSKLEPVSSMIANGQRPEDIAERLLEGFKVKLLALKELNFKCRCNEQTALATLAALPKEELENLIKEGGAQITCRFCSQVYYFTPEQIEKILSEKREGK